MSDAMKCSIEAGLFVNACERLSEASEFGNPRGKQKGIYQWEYFVGESPSRRFYGVKSGGFVDAGIVFNFCPFCGERIDGPVTVGSEVGDE